MPTYEYECLDCKIHFDEFQRMSDSKLRKCPKCGGRLNRIISGGAGLIFKGSGFYITDYKKSGSTDPNKKPVVKKPDEKNSAVTDKGNEKKFGAADKKTDKEPKSEEGKSATDKKQEPKKEKNP
jgi:putative FmdB family regulatory protein